MQANILDNILLTNPLIKRGAFSLRINFFLKIASFFCVSLAIGLLGLCISQISNEVSAKYAIQKDKILAENLTQENNLLESEYIGINSSENISLQIQGLNFEKAGAISYIRVMNNQVVSR